VNCNFESEEFEAEKKVVIEELKGNLDSPWGLLLQELDASSYKVHPYRNPIVGWLDDVERATAAEQQTYYRKHYHPGNAVLVITGDFETDRVLESVHRHFATLPSKPPSDAISIVEPLQRGEKRVAVRWRSKVPRLAIAYHAPAIAHRDSYALQVLGVILAEGKASRLYQRMVEREQNVTFVTAEYGESKDPTLFHIRAEARGEHPAEAVESSVYDALKAVVNDGVSLAELDRAKHQIEAHYILSRERTLDQAILLGQIETLYGLDYLDSYIARITAVTADDVAEVCSRYLTEDNRSVGCLVPDATASVDDLSDEEDAE
jgi:predicted Zn-dependent peptidase